MASLEDVARAAGVSTTTASRALRDSPKVRERTRERVRAAAEELGFVASRAAASLATGRSGRIAVLSGDPLREWFSGAVLDGLYETLRDAGYDLLVYRVRDEAERKDFFARLPATRNADALVVASFTLTPEERDRLRLMDMPLVYLNQRADGEASVSVDDRAAARAAARHLLELGHTNIAYVRAHVPPGFSWSSTDRYDAFGSEMAAAGPGARETFIVEKPGDGFGDRVLSRLLAAQPRPSAVLVEEDGLAIQIMAAIWRLGLRVPDDLSVMGFDDHALAGSFGLTTMRQDAEELARRAASAAIALAENRDGPRRAVSVPASLVIRASTRRRSTTDGVSSMQE